LINYKTTTENISLCLIALIKKNLSPILLFI
jgi:hypothetical protein